MVDDGFQQLGRPGRAEAGGGGLCSGQGDVGAGAVAGDPGRDPGDYCRHRGETAGCVVEDFAPQRQIAGRGGFGDRCDGEVARVPVLHEMGQLDGVLGAHRRRGPNGAERHSRVQVAVQQVTGVLQQRRKVAMSREVVECRPDCLGEVGAVGSAGEPGFELGAVGEGSEAVVGGFGGDAAGRVEAAVGAVGKVPGVLVDEHGLPQHGDGKVVGAAFQERPAGLWVLGVGDQRRVGGREPCPDAIQHRLGRTGLPHFGEIGSGGDLDLVVVDDDDHQ